MNFEEDVMSQKQTRHDAIPEKGAVDRRHFLKGLGTGAGATAMVAASTIIAAAPAEAAESTADKKKKRYKETEHVKAYYRTNRY
jgi:secreted PhoX family phosphatase